MAISKRKPAPMIKNRCLGRFRLSREILFSMQAAELKKLFSLFVIIRAEYLIHIPAFEYYAYSELFDPVGYGQDCPLYEITCSRKGRQVIISASQNK